MDRPDVTQPDPQAQRPLRDPGDAWVIGPDGQRYWGRFGAAGLLLRDSSQRVLLQHRVPWSHFGNTWGIPGGALQAGEQAVTAAVREAHEEAGVPPGAVSTLGTRVIDHRVWSYTTVIAQAVQTFDPYVGDNESLELAWVPTDHVANLPLHPAFAQSWPALLGLLQTPRITLVVDGADIGKGALLDGEPRTAPGAQTVITRLAQLVSSGMPAALLGLDATRWYVDVHVLVDSQSPITLTHIPPQLAPTNPAINASLEITAQHVPNIDETVGHVRTHLRRGSRVYVVTDNQELQGLVHAQGAESRSLSWLTTVLASLPGTPAQNG